MLTTRNAHDLKWRKSTKFNFWLSSNFWHFDFWHCRLSVFQNVHVSVLKSGNIGEFIYGVQKLYALRFLEEYEPGFQKSLTRNGEGSHLTCDWEVRIRHQTVVMASAGLVNVKQHQVTAQDSVGFRTAPKNTTPTTTRRTPTPTWWEFVYWNINTALNS